MKKLGALWRGKTKDNKTPTQRGELANVIIGELLTQEKYRLIDARIISDVVRETIEIINDGEFDCDD